MTAALATTLRESCGYLEDEEWHQTAQLMSLAADEIDRLNARVHELETARATAQEIEGLRAPDASNQNVARVAVAARR
jgi:tellurite resistance protein